jgi:hypothetical protein
MKSQAATQNMRRSGPAVRVRRQRHGASHDPTSVKGALLLGRPSVLPDRKTHADRELILIAGRYCCRVRTGAILLVRQRVG